MTFPRTTLVVCATLFSLPAFARPAPAAKAQKKSEIVIDDDFNDGKFGENPTGKGTWITKGSPQTPAIEDNGTATITLDKEEGNRALLGDDKFNFWDDKGVTLTWKINAAKVLTKHKYRAYIAIVWDLGIISGHTDNHKSSPYLAMQNFGGFYVRLGHKDGSNEVELSVNVTNKNLNFHNNDIAPNTAGYAQPSAVAFRVQYPLVITAHLSKKGWSVAVKQPIETVGLAGNWESDLATAPITDEFKDGAFLMLQARNCGIDGKYAPSYPPNSVSMDRVTVTRDP